jgi:hypothetical protein
MSLNKKIILLLSLALIGIAVMLVMYLTSENQMHHNNPFLRRYITGSVEREGEMNLHNSSLYFAGTDGTKIYLGDSQAPLHIFEIDTLLKKEKHYIIQLENDKFPFRRVQLRIYGDSFYVLDGTVPVIFRGSIHDWKAKIVMTNKNYYFSNAEVLASNEIVFKNYEPNRKESVIGKINFGDTLAINYAHGLLQKQIDGLFDVDGIMRYSPINKRFVYLYSYRNQFSVTNDKLKLLYRGNTIDTNRTVNFKVSYDESTGVVQLASPANIINKTAALRDNLLFVNSTIPGKYESKHMWEIASIIDVYNIEENTYLSSAYIYNEKKSKLRDILIVNSNLFVLIGNQIHRYRLYKHLSPQK